MDSKTRAVCQRLSSVSALLNGISVRGYSNLEALAKAIKMLEDTRVFVGNELNAKNNCTKNGETLNEDTDSSDENNDCNLY